ncbi:MAG: hypothetical protein ABH821_03980 [archaeon]
MKELKMAFFGKFSGLFRGMAERILDLDNSIYPEEQFTTMRDMMRRQDIEFSASDLRELVLNLKKKHVIDSLSISEANGSLMVSSNNNGVREAVTGASLISYVKSEVPKSQAVYIKTDSWIMLIPYKSKVFIVKAAADLTTIELKAIIKDVEDFLTSRHQSF